jgi:UDP-2,4-diacetamido-2,4,6-trideoxy-beta-L-altropyranose hydrolase
MSELMAWADVAVSSGGTTCWELAFMGLPSIVGQMAVAEELLVGGLRERGLFLHVGWFEQASALDVSESIERYLQDLELRGHMSHLGRQTIDGHGSSRVIEAMSNN